MANLEEITQAITVPPPAPEAPPEEAASDPQLSPPDLPHTAADHEQIEEEESPLLGEEEDDSDEVAADSNLDEYLDISDDDMFEIKVDGEVEYRSVSDAKKALSGEGAVAKRLHEVSTQKAENDAVHQRREQELEQKRTEINELASQLDNFLFKPQVGVPNEAIRHSDPTAYLSQLDAYQADQGRITQAKTQMADNLQRSQQAQQQQNQQRLAYNETQLVAKIPELATPDKAKVIMGDIVQVGLDYGFSNEEIGEYFDHRSFKMAHDLAAFKKAQQKIDVTSVKKTIAATAPRRLRSGVAQRLAAGKQSAKARKAVVDKASTSGKTNDIAAMITKPGRRN